MKSDKYDLLTYMRFFFFDNKMVQYRPNIVIGYMEYLVMKHLAQDTGHVGMEQQLNNCALVDCCIMKMLTVVIGPKMLMDVKSIVSHKRLLKDFLTS